MHVYKKNKINAIFNEISSPTHLIQLFIFYLFITSSFGEAWKKNQRNEDVFSPLHVAMNTDEDRPDWYYTDTD